MIHLYDDAGRFTGESFASWPELYNWFWSVNGSQAYGSDKRTMRSGAMFRAGGKLYRVEVVGAEEHRAAA